MDLTTAYLGLRLKHPVVASASPFTSSFDGMRRLEDAGAAAVVMASLYEEQIRAEDNAYALLTEHGSFSQAEAGSYFPELHEYNRGVSGHLETLRRASEALGVPVIASLNGTSREGWPEYAKMLEQAGAAALELNLFLVPVDLKMSGQDVEASYLEVVRSVKASVRIPVSLKLSPFFSAMGHMGAELQKAGADGLVLFNRFFQRDIDLETLNLKLDVHLSTPAEIHLPMVWIALLSRQVSMSLAASSGVDSHEEVVKYLLAGADIVMTTSALLRHGPGHVQTLVTGLERWLRENAFPSVAAIRGLRDATHWGKPAELLRADYVKSLVSYVPKRLIA
ncbi:MAG: dihydroorotate dehydrogenase-like protein [Myxococcaceae bacterium]